MKGTIRNYSPSTGRFLSEDPIGFAGKDSNLYRYVENNSVSHTDPNGLIKFTVAVCSLTIGAGASIDTALGLSDLAGNASNSSFDRDSEMSSDKNRNNSGSGSPNTNCGSCSKNKNISKNVQNLLNKQNNQMSQKALADAAKAKAIGPFTIGGGVLCGISAFILKGK
jgi:uncharacterized protein RhaS with RHS repeats